MKRKNDILKELASRAKNRLKNGAYSDSQSIKNDIRKNFKIYEGGMKSNCKYVLLNKDEDEKFYLKVKNLLTENADIVNPIGSLIDKKKFNSLNDLDKELYLFKLVDKYREMKERFEKENLMESI